MRAISPKTIVFASVLMASSFAWAQQGTSGNTEQPGSDEGQTYSSSQGYQAVVDVRPSDPPPVVSLATGQALPSNASPVRFGHFSLASVDWVGAYDTSGNSRRVDYTAAAMRTLMVYSVKMNRFNVDLQYMPSLWFSEGKFATNLSGQSMAFRSGVKLSPRWTLDIANSASYYPDRGKLGDVTYTSDYITGTNSQNPYLSTGLKIFTEGAGGTLTYRASERQSLNFGVRYEYFRMFDLQNGQSFIADFRGSRRHNVSGDIGWAYNIDAHSVLRLGYSEENRIYTDSDTLTHSHVISAGYARQFGPGLKVIASFGPSIDTGYFRSTDIGYRGALTIAKRIGKNDSASFSFSRDSRFNGITSDVQSNRYDLSYTRSFGRKISSTFVFSDSQQAFSKGRGSFSGWAAGVETTFYVRRGWQFYFICNHVQQPTLGSLNGPRTVIASGLRWTWSRER